MIEFDEEEPALRFERYLKTGLVGSLPDGTSVSRWGFRWSLTPDA